MQRQIGSNPHALAYFDGCVHLLEGRTREAIDLLEQAKEVQVANRPSLYLKLGDAHFKLEAYSAARRLLPQGSGAGRGSRRSTHRSGADLSGAG